VSEEEIMRELILIHGRAQEWKDAKELKRTWVSALQTGFENANLDLTLDDSHVHFPFYGNTLIQMISNAENVDSIVVKGGNDTVEEREAQLMKRVVVEVLKAKGIPEAEIDAAQTPAERSVKKKGPLNWGWVLSALRVLNDHGFGTAALELCTRDVYQYLYDSSLRAEIDAGVAKAFSKDEAVVVAHSLGTVVAYSVIRLKGPGVWNVGAFVTLGSPLAIEAINQLLPALEMPTCVKSWFNARDPKDTVALYPLVPDHFPDLGIEAKNDVVNKSSNHHSIEEYLHDPDVARWIYNELTAK
jgi:hypothetical protein